VLYLFSNVLKFILFNLVGYRKKVIISNLNNSFPQKTEKEIKVIADKFYVYFCDLLLETLQTLILPASIIKEKCKVSKEALSLINGFEERNQSIIIVMGHWGNWEWGGAAFGSECKMQLNVIYHPLHNKVFNRLVRFMRMRYGTGLIAMNEAFREMVKSRNKVTATAFIADQSPPPEGACWLKFLHQDTAFFRGPETIAKKMNLPVVYVSLKRLKRGQYELNAELLIENPKLTDNGFIIEAFANRLEKDIVNHPEIWLWSHKRWKHNRQK
jgi:KDO2-lipid IV(A) lauroyltransferase